MLAVFSTHGVAGLTGGLLVGLLANPNMLMYIGTDKEAPGFSVTGLLYGNAHQLLLQEHRIIVGLYHQIHIRLRKAINTNVKRWPDRCTASMTSYC